MYFNAINSNDANYMYNGDMEDGVVNKIEVYAQNADQQTGRFLFQFVCLVNPDQQEGGRNHRRKNQKQFIHDNHLKKKPGRTGLRWLCLTCPDRFSGAPAAVHPGPAGRSDCARCCSL